ncbi:uncharacterized protein LOC114716366 [Neltuma alba]|uniref:uncharacterized protein LOC114716366 n=1 Tax=Neltuma alba TaxID=207710 RepID=UPI0010A4B303|nr:uncharacterized protein LOC114716366 [Prosopis alba]
MGLSASTRVKNSLSQSPEFESACEAAFSYCLSQTQHAFQGVFPYQLHAASDYIHSLLSDAHPHRLILRWLSAPPARSQVDSALRFITPDDHHDALLGPLQFKAWALHLYTDAVLSSAGKALLFRVPIGVAGIAGIGALTRSGNRFVGTAIGAYSLGVAFSILAGLSG